MDAEKRRILGIGGANLDIHTALKAPAVLGDSNPSRISMSAGGVMRNILEDLSLLGEDCSLMSAVGRDPFGEKILASCRDAGIDCSAVYVSGSCGSSCYFDMIEPGGEMIIAGSDMEVIETMPPEHIEAEAEALRNARAVILDGNPTRGQLEKVLEIVPPGTPVFADPVSAAKVMRFEGLLGRLALFKPNLMELEKISGIPCSRAGEALSHSRREFAGGPRRDTGGPNGSPDEDGPDRAAVAEAADRLLSQGLGAVAVSLGKHGCYFADSRGKRFFSTLRTPLSPVNTTGAGDAFMAGMVSSLLLGEAPETAALKALACGALTSASPLTVDPALSAEAIQELINASEIHQEVI